MKKILQISIFLLAFVILIRPCFAHKVVLFGWVENNTVHIEAGFGNNRPAMDCSLKAFDQSNTIIFQGRTDKNGKFTFQVPELWSGDMRLEVKAGPGHKGTWTILASEFAAPEATGKTDEIPEKYSAMNKGPSGVKIFFGILLIFALAIGIRQIKKKKADRT